MPSPRKAPAAGAFRVSRGCPMLPETAPDGEIYLSGSHAAREFGVAPSTISTWARKGYLTPAASSGRRALYRMSDVAKAEKLARDAAIRTSGTAKRVRRHQSA